MTEEATSAPRRAFLAASRFAATEAPLAAIVTWGRARCVRTRDTGDLIAPSPTAPREAPLQQREAVSQPDCSSAQQPNAWRPHAVTVTAWEARRPL